jgi:hypothetical protein
MTPMGNTIYGGRQFKKIKIFFSIFSGKKDLPPLWGFLRIYVLEKVIINNYLKEVTTKFHNINSTLK